MIFDLRSRSGCGRPPGLPCNARLAVSAYTKIPTIAATGLDLERKKSWIAAVPAGSDHMFEVTAEDAFDFRSTEYAELFASSAAT
ncbi:MAG: hypothetical protein E5X10_27810, partial [Mesorhizobium sp.]